MKTIKWIILSALLIIIFAMMLFPYEAYLKNLSQKFEKEKGVKTAWEEGSFYPWAARLKNVEYEGPNNLKLFYDSVTIQPIFIGLKIKCARGEDISEVRILKDKVIFDIKNFKLPENLKLLNEGNLSLKGYYNINKKNGIGSFTLTLDNLFFLDYRDKASLNGIYEVNNEILTVDFDLNGEFSSGEGTVKTVLDKTPETSRLTGHAYMHYKGVGKKFNITGTVNNITFEPEK